MISKSKHADKPAHRNTPDLPADSRALLPVVDILSTPAYRAELPPVSYRRARQPRLRLCDRLDNIDVADNIDHGGDAVALLESRGVLRGRRK